MEKAPAERAAFLDEAARSDADLHAQVKRMLDAHESTVTFLDGAVAAPAELRTDPRRMEGRCLGHYEILREIGRGGMGTRERVKPHGKALAPLHPFTAGFWLHFGQHFPQ